MNQATLQRHWPFLANSPIEISRAEGLHLYTRKGDKILDAAGGAIVANIGYGRKRVAEAVYEATLNTTYVVPPWQTESRLNLVNALNDWLPESLSRVHITSGGTEAVEAAVKLALQYQQAIGERERTVVISRDVSYHGTTLATASLSGHPARQRGLEGALPHFPRTETPYPLRCPLGSHHADCGTYYVEALRNTIGKIGAERVAAFVAEPITGSSGGAIVPPDEYWPQVRALLDEHGILLVQDEVMTGFGRTGTDFGYQHWDYTPDILVSGKGLAGGYAPLGGVFAAEKIGTALAQVGYGVMFNTFGAHPAACAAAVEVLDILREEDLVAQAAQQGAKLAEALQQRLGQHARVAEIRGRGLLQAIEVVRDRETLEPYPMEDNITNKIVNAALERGVFFYSGGTGAVRDIICMGPAFTLEDRHIEQIVETLAVSVDEATA